MKTYWQFLFPGQIYFGENALNELEKIYGKFPSSNTLVITDPGIKACGILDKVTEKLTEFNISYIVFDEAKPEPSKTDVEMVVGKFKNEKIDIVIGLGGGSAIDLAKMISFMIHSKESLDYYYSNPVHENVLPVIAIPTTAGTGSEVTGVAVVNDEERKLKIGISSNYLKPKFAILEPALTLGMPARITAVSGIDALVHAIEAYTAKDFKKFDSNYYGDFRGATIISDVFAKEAISLIINNIEKAVHQGDDLEARSNMLLGSLLAGIAFSNAGTSLAHAMAYAIAGRAHSPHGEITGLMLPYAIFSNFEFNEEKYKNIGQIYLNDSNAEVSKQDLFENMLNLLKNINLPIKLAALGIEESQLNEMAKETMNITRLMNINPRTLTEGDVLKVFQQAL